MFSWTMLISGNKLSEQIQRFVAGIFSSRVKVESDLREEKTDLDADEGLTS